MEEQILQLKPPPGASALEAQAEPLVADVSPDDLVRQRYADVIGGLVDDAVRSKMQSVLADVVAFNLAWFIVEYGPVAAGHVLERLGSYIAYFVERNRAAREAEAAREEGRLAH